MTVDFAFLSLGYKVKAFLTVSPGNTVGPAFQRTMLMCFHTSASSLPVPGQMPLSQHATYGFFIGLVEEH